MDLPHQKCLKHSLDNIIRITEYQPLKVKENKFLRELKEDLGDITNKKYQELQKVKNKIKEIEELLTLIKKYLWESREEKSDQLERIIILNYKNKYPKIIEFLKRNKKDSSCIKRIKIYQRQIMMQKIPIDK